MVAHRLVVPLSVLLGLGAASPAGADALVTISASRDGATVQVTGSAVLPDGPLASVLQDAGGDVNVAGAQAAGDLVGVSLATQGDGDLVVRWSLAALSAEPNGTLGLARLRFRAGGATYEVGAARNDYSAASTDPGGWLIRCGATSCGWLPLPVAEGTTLLSRDVGVTLDSNADFIEATVPVTALAGVLAPGSVVGPLTGSGTEASTSAGQLEGSGELDTAEMTGTYVYGLTVLLGSGAPGADPATIDYPTPATVDPDNVRFSGSLEVAPGQAVFAMACLGAGNCAYGQTGEV